MKTRTHQITKSGSAYASKWCKSDCKIDFEKCSSYGNSEKCDKSFNQCLSKCGSGASDYVPYSSASCDSKCYDKYAPESQSLYNCLNDCTPRYYTPHHSAYRPSYDDCMKQCDSGYNYDTCVAYCSQ